MRVVVADDAAILREGLVGLLARQGHEVIAQVETADELIDVVDSLAASADLPDLVITDVRMPPHMEDDGLRAAVQIRATHPTIGLLVFSQYVASTYARALFSSSESEPGANLAPSSNVSRLSALTPQPVRDALGNESATREPSPGGLGYLLKDRITRVADFMQSLSVIAAGGMVVDPQVAAHLMQHRAPVLQALTPREAEVLELMAQGLSNSQIQEKLFVSAASVSKHVANVFMKLGLGPEEENRRVRAVLMYLTQTR
ncbi:MAG: response regulator transcription factor [Actinomycetaceae bacterium]|nr:response regulator transcription factor [Actinomycetaceae bacterium]